MAMVEKISLYFQQGSSDKFYNICIMEEDGLYTVPFTYGRRGTSGNSGNKVSEPTDYETAKKAYDKVVKQKRGKGYKVGTGPGVAVSAAPASTATPMHVNVDGTATKVFSGVLPQLLCPIEEDDPEYYIQDPRYGAQEKKDGRRKFMQKKDTNQIVSINRKGQEVGYPEIFTAACQDFTENNQVDVFILDGEEVNNKLFIFDARQLGGADITGLSYGQRYNSLSELKIEGAFELLPLAVTEEEKRELYERLKKEGKEGIVFKLLDAPYTEGRPSETFVSYAQLCPQVKFKFYDTATCIVIKKNVKRSVQLGLYNENNELTFVGNCTIPPNKDIPEANDLVEIRYLYAYKGGSLYQPTYQGLRDDIEESACVMAQLKYKAEE